MPIETIKCQECGSADVTEFKSGSYVCGHCEAVFKHLGLAASSASIGCELRGCGVVAVGRCDRCSRAFCTSHRNVGSLRHCGECSTVEQEIAFEAQAKRLTGDEARATRRRNVASKSDPIERLLCAILLHGRPSSNSVRDAKVLLDATSFNYDMNGAWGNPTPAGVIMKPQWDSEEIAQWFSNRAVAAGIQPNSSIAVTRYEHKMFGKEKRVTDPAAPSWKFACGSSVERPEHNVWTAHVLTDGRIVHCRDDRNPPLFSSDGGDHLSAFGLYSMAQLLNL